jgi:hypothetical protein
MPDPALPPELAHFVIQKDNLAVFKAGQLILMNLYWDR